MHRRLSVGAYKEEKTLTVTGITRKPPDRKVRPYFDKAEYRIAFVV